jgi:nucleoside-diphosphate-sugar epimerase
MRCAITGANGFVGSHLAERLVEQGHEVRALVRATSDLSWLGDLPLELIEGDLHDGEALRRAFEGCELVFHLAGVTSASKREAFFSANVDGARNAAQACLDAAGQTLQRFVLVSSLAASGPGVDDAPVTETSEGHPVNWYGESKLAGEREVQALSPRLPLTIVRPGAIYGPRDKDHLGLIKAAAWGLRVKLGLGRRAYNFCHVDDVVSATLLAATRKEALGETFLVGDVDNYTLTEVGEILVRLLRGGGGVTIWLPVPLAYGAGALGGLAARIRGGRPDLNLDRLRLFAARNWTMDVKKARRKLGYAPRFVLEAGMANTIAWYREVGWL